MVQLLDSDIQTKEVLDWHGLHLFHMHASSCSQKLRIYLNLKQLEWRGHELNLLANENLSPWYLGINPRGLVPTLIDDGVVHIESNDILVHLEDRFPEPPLIAPEHRSEIETLLGFEDDLHLELRTLSFRFLFAPPKPPKSAGDLAVYAATGSGTVGGSPDPHIAREIGFWRSYAEQGVTDDMARSAAAKFHAAFADLDVRLARQPFIIGDAFSVVDIAWIVYAERLRLAGYPLARLHPNVAHWLAQQGTRPEIAPEIAMPAPMIAVVASAQAAMAARGETLDAVCFNRDNNNGGLTS